MALVMGEIGDGEPALVRVHLEHTLCDLFSNLRGDCGWPLRDTMARINQEGKGVIVILRSREDADTLLRQILDYEVLDQGIVLPKQQKVEDLRTYGIGAQILLDLGVRHMRVSYNFV